MSHSLCQTKFNRIRALMTRMLYSQKFKINSDLSELGIYRVEYGWNSGRFLFFPFSWTDMTYVIHGIYSYLQIIYLVWVFRPVLFGRYNSSFAFGSSCQLQKRLVLKRLHLKRMVKSMFRCVLTV